MNKPFECLYDVLVNNNVDVSKYSIDPKQCIKIAERNKVLLEFLARTEIDDDMRIIEEKRFHTFLTYLGMINGLLNGLNFMFIKLVKPLRYVPSDIDILIDFNDLKEAYSRLSKVGFKIDVIEPYTLTLKDSRNYVIDLYIQPTIAGIIYMDGSRLFQFKTIRKFYGLTIPVPSIEAETVLVIAHAVYKERIYTMNDFITIKEWMTQKAVNLAEEFKVIDGVKEVIRLNEMVSSRKIDLPHKIKISRWILIGLNKILHDGLTMSSLAKSYHIIKDRRFGYMVYSKLFKSTY